MPRSRRKLPRPDSHRNVQIHPRGSFCRLYRFVDFALCDGRDSSRLLAGPRFVRTPQHWVIPTTCRWSASPPAPRNALLTAAAGSSATRGEHPLATMATTTFLPTPIPAASPDFRRRSVLHRRERAYGWVRFRQLSLSTALCGDPLCRIPQERRARASRGSWVSHRLSISATHIS